MPRKKATKASPAKASKPASYTVTNCVPHTELHLGDGRSIQHGESAEVTEAIRDLLVANKQAK